VSSTALTLCGLNAGTLGSVGAPPPYAHEQALRPEQPLKETLMKAADAVDGGLYNLPARGSYPAVSSAVCNGWNHSKEWLLFVVFDEQHVRKIRQIMPTEDIQPVDQRIAL
jgi:hypothetical protein